MRLGHTHGKQEAHLPLSPSVLCLVFTTYYLLQGLQLGCILSVLHPIQQSQCTESNLVLYPAIVYHSDVSIASSRL